MIIGHKNLQGSSGKYSSIDLESLIFAVFSILAARAITMLSQHVFWYAISLLFSFVPIVIISFKLVRYLESKNVFPTESRSIRLSLFALFLVPITYVPITILNYVTESFVLVAFVFILIITGFGNKLAIRKVLSGYVYNFTNSSMTDKRNLLVFIQVALFAFISLYLNDQTSPIPPNGMAAAYMVALGVMLIIPSYLIATNARLKYYSMGVSAIFLFSFLLLQNMVYFGGDSGLFISVTKYLSNGGSADFISVEDRWRFGSTALLGLPALSAYLSEASGLTPDISIPFETAASIIFVLIGGIVYAEFIGKNEFEKSAIFFAYVLLQPAIYYSELNVFRSTSILLMVLPFTIPLFAQIRFNAFGKLSFVAAMFSLAIIHPLSFVIIVVMMLHFLRSTRWKERIAILSLVMIMGLVLLVSPSMIRAVSISPEELPELTLKMNILEQLTTPFPAFTSSAWAGVFVQKISLLATILLAFTVILYRDFPLPRFPVMGFLIVIFVLAFIIESNSFPINRLLMFLAALGIVVISTVLIRKHQIIFKIIGRRKLNEFTFRPMISISVKVAVFSLIAFLIIMSSYPRDRSLMLDTYSLAEYYFLKEFVVNENQNFDQSMIFSHIETLRYLNGIEGSIIYYNDAPKAFSIDFTDRPIATEHYGAFSALLSGDSLKARSWLAEHNLTSAYVVIMYRFVPSGVNFDQGELVLQNEVGMVRKIHFSDSIE